MMVSWFVRVAVAAAVVALLGAVVNGQSDGEGASIYVDEAGNLVLFTNASTPGPADVLVGNVGLAAFISETRGSLSELQSTITAQNSILTKQSAMVASQDAQLRVLRAFRDDLTQISDEFFCDSYAVRTFRNVSGEIMGSYADAVYVPATDLIYSIPSSAETIMVINPQTGAVDLTSLPVDSGENKWIGGTLGPDGKIYGIPRTFPYFLVFDPTTNATNMDTIAVGDELPNFPWNGAAVGSQEHIYLMPHMSNTIGIINIRTNETSGLVLDDVGSSTPYFTGGVRAYDGRIFGVPFNAPSVLVITPAPEGVVPTESTVAVRSLALPSTLAPQVRKWRFGVLAPNGKIYCIPTSVSDVLIIDPAADAVHSITISGVETFNFNWAGGALLRNGVIAGFPAFSSHFLLIDPETDTAQAQSSMLETPDTQGGSKWFGGAANADSSRVFLIPTRSDLIIELQTFVTALDTGCFEFS